MKPDKTKKGSSTSAIDSNHDVDSGNENEKRVMLKLDKTKKGGKHPSIIMALEILKSKTTRMLLKPDKTKKGSKRLSTNSNGDW